MFLTEFSNLYKIARGVVLIEPVLPINYKEELI
jgi:hypothetical protein